MRADVVPSSHVCLPKKIPICSLRIVCSETSLRRSAEGRACASYLLFGRCKLKKIRAGSRMHSAQSAQCASGVGPCRNALNFGFAFSNVLSSASNKIQSVSSLLLAICGRLRIPLSPDSDVDADASARSTELAGGVAEALPKLSANLRLACVFQSTRQSSTM